ncbi:putative ubiquitin carboxyl-terminal hydrolase FAF-X, partial [Clonorchis sinensis]
FRRLLMSDPAIQPAFTSGESSPDYTVIDSKPGSPVSSDQSASNDTSPKADVTQNLLDFPTQSWTTLNSCLNMVKWVVPVLPDSHLEILLKAAIELAKQDRDTDFPKCQDFYSSGLLSSFQKTFQDEAVDGWDCQILHYIYMNALLAVELCAVKAAHDASSILILESILFDPDSRFQQFSVCPVDQCWRIQHGEKINSAIRYTHITPLLPHLLTSTPDTPTKHKTEHDPPTLKEFAILPESKRPAPILKDFIDLFGRLNGFERLKGRFLRFAELNDMTLCLIATYLYPFSLCCDYLHPDTITEYFVPIVDIVVPHIVNITEQGMKKDSKLDIKTDSLADLGFYLRSFLLHMPEKTDFLEKVDLCCLNLILRYLQFPSFNKRMMALNDLNSLFSRLSPSGIPSQSSYSPSSDTLTIDRIATWMHDKQVLGLMLRENLHQLQYVEKAERIIRFMVKHAYLTTADLDQIWEAQDGKHQTIAKNVFDMLARLALEFTPEQLDHLFHRFQQSWSHATKRQREHLIDLICRLAEEDRDGLMAAKVLNLLWELAVDADSSPDISSFALKAHAKILDHNISEVGSNIRSKWITRLIGILKGGPREPHLLPAIRQFTEILNLIPAKQYSSHTSYLARMKTIQELNARHSLLESIVNNVVVCMMTIREQRIATADAADANVPRTPMRRISLQVEVRELLELVRFLLFEGSFIFPIDWMIRIWRGMLLRSPEEDPQTTVTPEDRELCYQWFGSLPPATIPAKNYGIFFDECILRVDPSHLTASGMMLFKIFFYQVNYQLGYLLSSGVGNSSAGNSGLTSSVDLQFLTDNADLCGLDNIWRILLDAPSSVALEAMQLLEKLYTNLSPQLLPQKRERHEDLLQHCFSRLRADYDTIHILMNSESHTTDSEMTRALDRVVRVIHLLQHFLVFDEELAHPSPKRTPLKRAWVGTSIRFSVVFYSSLSDFRGSTYHGDGFIAPRTTSPVHENDSIDQFRDVGQHTIQFTAHANMTIGELRSHLLAFRLRSLRSHTNCLPQQETGSATATSAFSGDNPTGYEDHSYKLELYVSRLEDRRPPASSVSPLLSGVPIDSSSNDSSVLILLSQFPEWPHAFMDAQEDINLAELSRDFDDSSPRLQLVAHIVLGTPELSHLRNRKRNMEVTTRVDTSRPVTDDFLHRSCTDSAVFSEDTQCENEPQLDSVIASPSSYEDSDPVTSEQRCKFLLQLAKMAVRVNNPTFFSGVMEVLLSLPAPRSLMERIRLDVHASSASIPDSDNLKTELTDWVTVQTADHTAFKGSYLGQLLTSTIGSSPTQSSVDGLDHLVDLYYTLQLLYSLCLPSPAVTQYQDYLASANQDLLTRLSLGDLTNLPVWRDASQFTLQLLRAGVIPLLLSCLALLNQTNASPVSPDSVQSTVSRLIEIWLTRMLNLLLTVVAFTVVCLARSSEQPSSVPLETSHADFEDQFTKRFQIFCAARKKALQQNDPILTGDYYVVRHAEFVGHLAKNSGVTTAEVQTRWLPDPKASAETISLHTFPWTTNDSCISPLQNDASSQNFTISATKESGIDCTLRDSNIERRNIPKVAQTSLDGVNCSECRPSSFSLSNTSGSNVGSSERNSETDLTKQILQAFRAGDTVGMLAVESLCCVPYCIAFFPQSPLAKPIVGLSAPGSSDSLTWTQFVQELLFSRSPLLRHLTVFNLYQSVILPPVPVNSSTIAEPSVNPAVHLVRLLFSFHSTLVPKHVAHADQYFRLVALLLRHIHEHGIPFEEATNHLTQEVNWLRTTIASRKSQDKRPNSELSSLQSVPPAPGDTDCPQSRNTSDQLLCGHMRICSALLAFPCLTETPDSPTSSSTSSPVSPMLFGYTAFQKQYLTPLITDILQSLLFPAREQDDMTSSTTCGGFLSDNSLNSVFELLLALAKRDPSAVHLLSSRLCRSCFPDDFELSTYPWDYTPPPIYSSASKTSHFVGLRNGGATCYMNAILQQLFSLIPIRNAVLCARPELRLSEENVLGSKESDVLLIEAAKISPPASTELPTDPTSGDTEKPEPEVRAQKNSEERKPLNGEQTHQLRLLFHLQSIFGHLNHSLLKSYRPTEFWHEFRFVSEQVKLSEQQDALEFLQTLGNDVDESLHLCNMSKAVEEVLGGTFADQKICIDCPHRYSRNESFTTLNVDIRNHQNLLQSLEQYVKGDRLEGDNAYWCENCNKKVTTLKRMCIDRLPKVLAIQLKRFDYDWDRGVAIKFNDYFEFPRELDMYPYTAQGLSSQVPNATVDLTSAETMEESNSEQTYPPPEVVEEDGEWFANPSTRYTLRGVVVHSGQASAGHYYSFIRHFCPKTKTYKWYKFDDTEVTLSRMDEEDEAKAAWFGGDSASGPSESNKYTFCWTNSRWWSAYILFYEREDFQSHFAITKELSITPRLKKMVNRENVDYLHQQMQFHPLLSRFLASLTGAALDTCAAKPAVSEDLALTTLKLLVNYSFTVRFQNVARDWQLWIPLLLRLVALHPVVREKFLQWTLFSSPDRVCELLFECPYPEVRFLFAIMIVYIAQFKSSTLCQTSLDCLKSFEETRDSYFNSLKPPEPANADASLAARAESAREILGSLICSSDATQCEKPSLTDVLLQVVILQLRASPAEFIKRDVTSGKQVTLSDQYGDAGYQSSIQARALCGSSYSRAYRDLSHHPHTWNQYFSIFLDYVNSGEAARLRLLRLGFVEVVLSSAMKNQHVFCPSTLPHSLPSISSAGIRTPEVLKRQFIRILADLPDYLNSEPNQLLTSEPLCPLFSVSLESFVLALTSPYSSYSTLYNYGTNSSSGTSSAVTAGTTNLWSVLSLLIRSMDVSAYCRVHTHSSPHSKLPSPASSSERTTTATSTTANEDVKFVDDSSDMAASQPSYQNNPYAVGRVALAPISKQLADIIFRPRSNQPMSFFLRFWFNPATLDHVTNTLLFLAYENLDFSKLTLDWIVWGINSCQTDVALLLSLLQSLLTISDSHKANRLRWALGNADRTGLTSSRPENQYRQSFTHYSRAIKMFMELILDDSVVLQFFQEDDIALDWLRQWIEAIADSMRASASISQAHWLSPGAQPTQAQDAFMSLVQQVYTVLPLSDDEQSESEGVEYEESGDQMEF